MSTVHYNGPTVALIGDYDSLESLIEAQNELEANCNHEFVTGESYKTRKTQRPYHFKSCHKCGKQELIMERTVVSHTE